MNIPKAQPAATESPAVAFEKSGHLAILPLLGLQLGRLLLRKHLLSLQELGEHIGEVLIGIKLKGRRLRICSNRSTLCQTGWPTRLEKERQAHGPNSPNEAGWAAGEDHVRAVWGSH